MGTFTKRLVRCGERARERERARFPRAEMCHDCAFRPDSPERQDPDAWARLLEQAKGPQPFYCHFTHDGREMPTDADGNYVPPRREDGSPKGWPICAGWIRVFDVELRRFAEVSVFLPHVGERASMATMGRSREPRIRRSGDVPCADCHTPVPMRELDVDELAVCDDCRAFRREAEDRVQADSPQAGANFVGRERETRDVRPTLSVDASIKAALRKGGR